MPSVMASHDCAGCRTDRRTSPAAHRATDDGSGDRAAPCGTLRERIRHGDCYHKRAQNQ